MPDAAYASNVKFAPFWERRVAKALVLQELFIENMEQKYLEQQMHKLPSEQEYWIIRLKTILVMNYFLLNIFQK